MSAKSIHANPYPYLGESTIAIRITIAFAIAKMARGRNPNYPDMYVNDRKRSVAHARSVAAPTVQYAENPRKMYATNLIECFGINCTTGTASAVASNSRKIGDT